MIWGLVGILAIILSLLQDLLPIIGVALLIIFTCAVYMGISNAIKGRIDACVAAITEEVNSIISRYSPAETFVGGQAITYRTTPKLLNREIVDSVRSYKSNLAKTLIVTKGIDQQIKDILACQGCVSPKEKLEYLKQQNEELEKLKAQSDACHRKLENQRIMLLHEDGNKLFNLKKAFISLSLSKKCFSDTISIEAFIGDIKPRELSIFQYKYEPVILRYRNFSFCLFSNVILVFDENGLFSSALDPTAINISVERKTESVYVSNDSNFISQKFVDTDSKRVQEGNTTSYWLYSNKDGSPDRRRTYNPLMHSRTDVYEYGEVLIDIVDAPIVFTVSSQTAIERLQYVGIEYSQKNNHLHNPTGDLIKLLKYLSGSNNDEAARELEKIYSKKRKNENYFCKQIAL